MNTVASRESATLLDSDQLNRLLDGLSHGVFVVDDSENLVYWNAWVSSWTGIQAAQAVGKALGGLFPALIAGEFVNNLRAALEQGRGFTWTQQTVPDKLDAVEAAMTRGDRPAPLQKLVCTALGSSSRGRLVLVEVLEYPFEESRPARRGDKPAANGSGSALAANLDSDRYGLIVVDRYGFIQQVNDAMLELIGYDARVLHDRPLRILLPELGDRDGEGGYRAVIEAARQRSRDGSLDVATAGGEVIKVEVELFEGTRREGDIVLLCRDVTRSSGMQDALLRQREQLSAIYSHVTDAILMVDRRGYLENSNAVANEMLGLGNRRNNRIAVDDVLRLKQADGERIAPFAQAMSRERTFTLSDGITLDRGGQSLPVVVSAVPIRDRESRLTGCVILLRAVNESRQVSTRLSWHETHDPLTQLANRREIENEIVRAIDAAHVDNISHLLLYIDLYNFSVVNDTCGHAAGDELLRQFARLMGQTVGDQDVVARIGNDEFAILLWHREEDAAQEEAERLLKTITEFSLPWGERRLKVGASIGVQPINNQSTSEIDIMLFASAACAAAREMGRNRIHYHRFSKDSFRRHSLSKWTARVSEALEENRFAVYCQPIVPARGHGKVKHYEALVRMLDPKGQIVAPHKFIPAAEFSGLVDDIDRWVFDKVFDTLAVLPADKQGQYGFSVNLSGNTICDERFREHVIGRFREGTVPPEAIRFEITETAAVKHFDRAIQFINGLKALGCSFALDDFGSGLSSFGYLTQLPVEYLKIDGSFVRRMEVGDVDYSMVSTINHLAHNMGLKTIAECVENHAQLSMLDEMGVDYIQGYVISVPVPLDTIL